ncbi:matrix metalloproteinase-17-like [Etheostoma cragini]|uniref:matrix metalloproteinase-17-like n=1 Tax=Etheostoma cragini TaxID=417921 RepID=UPI00155E8C91|nr:matrix metalloproteinase-17-like [Etheostoma cragini]
MVSLVLHKWMRNTSPEMLLLVPILWLLPLTGAAPSQTTEQLDSGVDWLSKFGYLPPPDPVTGQLQTKEALTKAIKAMQKYGGLKETGVLDQATLGLMTTPRCSLPDVSEAEVTVGRRKRSPTPQNKWNKRHLSWRVRTFPKDSALLGRDTVRALMYYALKVWSDIAPLNFHEVAGSDADIQIDFTKADHNDGYPFDGPGGTVAHAFFPGERFTAGDTHFDDDEAWTFRSPDSHGMDLFAVAVHEFGHAIGLVHTSAIESIMRPYYQGPVGDPLKYDLPYEDKVRVWQLYGVRDSVSHTNRPGNPSQTAEPPVLLDLPENRSTLLLARDAPDRCTSHFDAVAQIRGEAFFFKGKFFWRLTREKHLVSLRPAQIHRFWRGLPPNLDNDDHLRRMDLGYPKDSSLWKGLPPQLDDAMRWSDGSSYFFKGKEYWRVPSSDMEVEAGYPRLIAKDWLLCTQMQSDSPDTEPKSTETRVNVHHHPDHAENGYEVCSCTSDTASPLGARPSPSPLWLLPPLWTLSLALRSELL